MARVTMSQVARAAEVSVATVSHAINGTGTLPQATRERVRGVAEALGYVPYFGKGGGRPRTVVVACTTYGPEDWTFTSVPYFTQAITAAAGMAHAAGYALTVLPPTFPGDLWRSLDVDGVVLMDSPEDDPAAAVLRRRGVPVVFDGTPVPPRHGDVWVDNDHRTGTRTVLDHLADQGAERVALLAGPDTDHHTQAAVAAYQEWCAERGRVPAVVPPWAEPALADVLTGHDAVYGIYDPCGRMVLAQAARLGLRIPGDLLVVCASEDPAYALTRPPVSVLSLGPEFRAETAMAALIQLMEGTGDHPEPEPAPGKLIVRSSSLRNQLNTPISDPDSVESDAL